jgi:hypothetical protein
MFLGKPLFIWFGILAATCFILALISVFRHKIKYHRAFALAGLLFLAIHVVMVVLL